MNPSAEPVPGGVAPDPFAAPGGEWHPVSPRLLTVRRHTTLAAAGLVALPLLVVASWAALRWDQWWWPVVAAVLTVPWLLWRWIRAPRWVASWGWCERDEDLCVRSGLWTRRLSIVPFGRMQMVKVSSGPLLRRQGLANVELVTASESAGLTVPGLPADDATALRDRLIAQSDAMGSGL